MPNATRQTSVINRNNEHLPADPDALLTEAQAADFLSVSMRTLQAWRVRGGGPVFVRAGRAIRYSRRDLLGWIKANTVPSTSAELANKSHANAVPPR